MGEVGAGGRPGVPDLDDESARLLARIHATLDRLAQRDIGSRQVGGLALGFAGDLGRLIDDDHSRACFIRMARRVAARQVDPRLVRTAIHKTLREVMARVPGAEPLANVGAYLVATLRGILEDEAHREVEADPELQGTPATRAAAPGPYDDGLWDGPRARRHDATSTFPE